MGTMTMSDVLGGLYNIQAFTSAIAPIVSDVGGIIGDVRNLNEQIDPDEERRKALRAQQDLALRQLTQKQGLEEAQNAQSAALEKQKLAADAQDEARRRQAALKRAVARQTAAFGASGIGSGAGSSQAVLLGLFDESDEERAAREKMDTLRTRALDLGASQQKSINVLQRGQLAERQALERAVRF